MKEGFASSSATQTDQGLKITTCPAKSNRFINNLGVSMCCDGQVNSGICSANVLCSLSESSKGVPTCSTWYANYLQARGKGKCPPSLPYYFESMDGKRIGCTSGVLSSLGDAPQKASDPKCMIYPTQKLNMARKDSCLNVKFLENSHCFGKALNHIDTQKTMFETMFDLPTIIMCSYGDRKTYDFGTCYNDEGILRAVKSILNMAGNPMTINEFKATSAGWDPMYKLNFCSIANRYKLQKTLPFEGLKKAKVFD